VQTQQKDPAPGGLSPTGVEPGPAAGPAAGPVGNQRLTAWAGATLLVLFAIEGITLLGVRQLIVPHILIGLALIGPVALKLASTGYRFTRYYTRSPDYRRAGPPHPVLRVLAPFLIVATVALIGSGTLLILVGPGQRETVLGLHKASFAVWFVLTSVHVLAYVWRVPRLILPDLRGRNGAIGVLTRGASTRLGLVVAAVASGIAVATVLAGRAQPWVEIANTLREHDH
jgi:hypothetical protein